MLRPLILSTCLLLSLNGMASTPTQPEQIEKSMTPAEFKAAGLEKLSSEELAALNAWLNRDRTEIVRQAKQEAKQEATEEVKRERATGLDNPGNVARVPVTSKVLGEFIGWRGNTAFELENGQVWVQAESGEMIAKKRQGVTVTIKPGMMGSWFLKAEGYNSTVRVRRIK